jgi:hypothetical protein
MEHAIGNASLDFLKKEQTYNASIDGKKSSILNSSKVLGYFFALFQTRE